jgi:hypothetical protein
MKFTMKVAHKEGGESWLEHENRSEIHNEEEAKAWAERTLRNFNDTLRPHEKERKLIDVIFDSAENNEKSQHVWEKTNLYTIFDPRLGTYDTMRCIVCRITAKRYGLTSIKIDSKYRAKGYKMCPPEVKTKK